MEKMPLPSVPPTSYATVAAQSTVASIFESTSASLPSSRNLPSNPRLTPAGVKLELRSGNAAHGSDDEDGFTTVGPRRRTKPSLGTAKPNKVLQRDERKDLACQRCSPALVQAAVGSGRSTGGSGRANEGRNR
ncbi:hypothetical protein ISCGN_026243 [Ixodes scapularis]